MNTDHRFYLSTCTDDCLADLMSLGATYKRRAPRFCEWLRYGTAKEIVRRQWAGSGHEVVPGMLDPLTDWRNFANHEVAEANSLLVAVSYGVLHENEVVDFLCFCMAAEVRQRLTKGAKREPAS